MLIFPCWMLQHQSCPSSSSCIDNIHHLLPAHILALLSSRFLCLWEAAIATQTTCIIAELCSTLLGERPVLAGQPP